MSRFDWLQGDRGEVSFGVKASQKPFEKRAQSGFRGAMKES